MQNFPNDNITLGFIQFGYTHGLIEHHLDIHKHDQFYDSQVTFKMNIYENCKVHYDYTQPLASRLVKVMCDKCICGELIS